MDYGLRPVDLLLDFTYHEAEPLSRIAFIYAIYSCS